MRVSGLTLSLFVASALPLVSQSPSPGARTLQRGPPQSEPAAAQQQAASDPRGTNQSPLVVLVQPAPKTDDETAREQAKEDEEASAKRWTMGLGIATGVLGLFQLIAIGFQASIARQQNTIIRKQNAIMHRQRKAADAQSGYMRDGLAETRNSIDEATKSTAAMQSIANSMGASVTGLQRSLTISRDIADMQKLAIVLQNRAHLDVDTWKVYRMRDEMPSDFAHLYEPEDCAIRFFIHNKRAIAAHLRAIHVVLPAAIGDGYSGSQELDLPLEPQKWVQHEIKFQLPTDEARVQQFSWYALNVEIAIDYSDGFESRTKRFCRTTRSHANVLSGDSQATQYWLVAGGIAKNSETILANRTANHAGEQGQSPD